MVEARSAGLENDALLDIFYEVAAAAVSAGAMTTAYSSFMTAMTSRRRLRTHERLGEVRAGFLNI